MPSFLDLPFELQSHILQTAFLDALDSDLSSQPVRALSDGPTYHSTLQDSDLLHLSPMHQTTSTHDLLTQLLPLTISPCASDNNSEVSDDDESESESDSITASEADASNADDMTISPNQLSYCLRRSRRRLLSDAEATKVQMKELVVGQPWARERGDAYCVLWRRKERARILEEVIEAAMRMVREVE